MKDNTSTVSTMTSSQRNSAVSQLFLLWSGDYAKVLLPPLSPATKSVCPKMILMTLRIMNRFLPYMLGGKLSGNNQHHINGRIADRLHAWSGPCVKLFRVHLWPFRGTDNNDSNELHRLSVQRSRATHNLSHFAIPWTRSPVNQEERYLYRLSFWSETNQDILNHALIVYS